MVRATIIFLSIIFVHLSAIGQTLGGNAVFNFLKQPVSPQLSALGGVNISNISHDVSLHFHNPSMLQQKMSGQFSASFNIMPGDIKNYSLATAQYAPKPDAVFGLGINYISYGSIAQTDAIGNSAGTFSARDYVVQLSAAKQYKENWFYGVTFKFIQSSYGQYSSNGIAVDAGITYRDTTRHMQASVVVKNIGTQFKAYQHQKEELPFDLQAGITYRLAKAPLQFSFTAHNLHRFNLFYNDSAYLISEGEDGYRGKKFTINKLLSHLVLAAQFYPSNQLEITAGYNFLRRQDLNALNASNGLNGFTLGAGLLLKQLQIRYGTGFYQQNIFNHLGVNFYLK